MGEACTRESELGEGGLGEGELGDVGTGGVGDGETGEGQNYAMQEQERLQRGNQPQNEGGAQQQAEETKEDDFLSPTSYPSATPHASSVKPLALHPPPDPPPVALTQATYAATGIVTDGGGASAVAATADAAVDALPLPLQAAVPSGSCKSPALVTDASASAATVGAAPTAAVTGADAPAAAAPAAPAAAPADPAAAPAAPAVPAAAVAAAAAPTHATFVQHPSTAEVAAAVTAAGMSEIGNEFLLRSVPMPAAVALAPAVPPAPPPPAATAPALAATAPALASAATATTRATTPTLTPAAATAPPTLALPAPALVAAQTTPVAAQTTPVAAAAALPAAPSSTPASAAAAVTAVPGVPLAAVTAVHATTARGGGERSQKKEGAQGRGLKRGGIEGSKPAAEEHQTREGREGQGREKKDGSLGAVEVLFSEAPQKASHQQGKEKKGGSLEVAHMGKGEERRDGYEDTKRRRGGESRENREEVEGRLRECLRERRLWHLLEDRSPLLASLKAHVKHLWKMGPQAVQPLQDVLLAHEPTLEDLQGEKKGALQLFALLLGAPEVTSLRKDELAEVIVRADAWERVRGEGRGGMRGDSDSQGRVRVEISSRGGSIRPGVYVTERAAEGGVSIGEAEGVAAAPPPLVVAAAAAAAPVAAAATAAQTMLGSATVSSLTRPAPTEPCPTTQNRTASPKPPSLTPSPGLLLRPQQGGLSGVGDTGKIGDEQLARWNQPTQLNGPPSVSAPSPTPPGGQLGTVPAPSPPPASSREGQLGGLMLPQEVGLSDIGDERIARLNRPADVLLTEFLERRMRWEHMEERELLAAKLEAYIRSLIRTNPNALTGYQELFFARCAGAEEDVQQEKRDVVRVVALLLGCSVPAKAKKLQLVKAISACALWQAHRRREKGRGAGEKGGGGVVGRGRGMERQQQHQQQWRQYHQNEQQQRQLQQQQQQQQQQQRVGGRRSIGEARDMPTRILVLPFIGTDEDGNDERQETGGARGGAREVERTGESERETVQKDAGEVDKAARRGEAGMGVEAEDGEAEDAHGYSEEREERCIVEKDGTMDSSGLETGEMEESQEMKKLKSCEMGELQSRAKLSLDDFLGRKQDIEEVMVEARGTGKVGPQQLQRLKMVLRTYAAYCEAQNMLEDSTGVKL
ncbi:unnamed protein product [Closterium sp. NIES-54]